VRERERKRGSARSERERSRERPMDKIQKKRQKHRYRHTQRHTRDLRARICAFLRSVSTIWAHDIQFTNTNRCNYMQKRPHETCEHTLEHRRAHTAQQSSVLFCDLFQPFGHTPSNSRTKRDASTCQRDLGVGINALLALFFIAYIYTGDGCKRRDASSRCIDLGVGINTLLVLFQIQ